MNAGLRTIGLEKRYGGLTVASNIDFTLAPGDRTALIGPNGAGKSTFSGLVTGAIRPSGGRILLDGRDITDMPTLKIKGKRVLDVGCGGGILTEALAQAGAQVLGIDLAAASIAVGDPASRHVSLLRQSEIPGAKKAVR